MKFNFKEYHIRAMNAQTDEEKMAINKELKDYYAKLPEGEKPIFNRELESFLIKEMANIKSVFEGVKKED